MPALRCRTSICIDSSKGSIIRIRLIWSNHDKSVQMSSNPPDRAAMGGRQASFFSLPPKIRHLNLHSKKQNFKSLLLLLRFWMIAAVVANQPVHCSASLYGRLWPARLSARQKHASKLSRTEEQVKPAAQANENGCCRSYQSVSPLRDPLSWADWQPGWLAVKMGIEEREGEKRRKEEFLKENIWFQRNISFCGRIQQNAPR